MSIFTNWSKEEEDKLIILFNKKTSILDIADAHKRSPYAIVNRLYKLNLIDDDDILIKKYNIKINSSKEVKDSSNKSLDNIIELVKENSKILHILANEIISLKSDITEIKDLLQGQFEEIHP
jgi:hypothetical protein